MRGPLVLLLPALLLLAPAAPAQQRTEIGGPVSVVDAGTLRLGDRVVRLADIAAPAPGDQCPFRDRTIDCGRIATTALMDLTAGATVRCVVHGGGAAAAVAAATCRADGYDLSEGMVYTGWARPRAGAPARYRKAEQDARSRRRGLWQGGFPPAVDAAAAGD